ncbi:hypothetical protein HIM_07859 [Hirsutella minnesotensis 3608]|uniref:Uncharacterized protein n=1 Tax=Hirsutella minnesotensis 3608 TaxID=1043627 RepID=A0A0F8A414_9HYPO|nr:hypothetical protein HIM_07859 [Hirsutella minnesotensis 3608]
MQIISAVNSFVHNRYIQELTFYGIMYALVLGAYSARSAPIYNQKFKKTSSYHLPVHIVTGLTEITRYQIRAAKHDGHVLPNAFDIALCLTWAYFGLLLTRSLRRGDPSTTRPTYQAAAIFRPVATILAYVLGNEALYRAGSKLINSFIYARAGVFVVNTSGIMRKHSYASVYAVAIPISAVVAIHEANVTGAVGVYVALIMAVAQLNYYVSLRLRGSLSRPNDMITSASIMDLSLLMLLVLGFADLDIMKEMQKRTSLVADISDDYVSGGRRPSSMTSNSSFPGQQNIQWGEPKMPGENVFQGEQKAAPAIAAQG